MSVMADISGKFKFGWYGDGGHGERVIEQILAGKKTATACLAYEAEDSDVSVGDKLELVDKRGKVYGIVLITRVDIVPYGAFDEFIANACGHTLEELKELVKFANGREPGADEEMRVTHFKLVTIQKVKL